METRTETAADTTKAAAVVTGGKGRLWQARTPRKDGWTTERRERFFAALSTTCNVTTSAAAAGLNRSSAFAFRRRDAVFAAEWAEALASGYDRLEEGLLAAAIAGLHGEIGKPGADEDEALLPDAAVVALPTAQAVQVALILLGRGGAGSGRRRKRKPLRRATLAETDASIMKKLDSLARRLLAAPQGGDA